MKYIKKYWKIIEGFSKKYWKDVIYLGLIYNLLEETRFHNYDIELMKRKIIDIRWDYSKSDHTHSDKYHDHIGYAEEYHDHHDYLYRDHDDYAEEYHNHYDYAKKYHNHD
jgi:hypothetical protein